MLTANTHVVTCDVGLSELEAKAKRPTLAWNLGKAIENLAAFLLVMFRSADYQSIPLWSSTLSINLVSYNS